MWLLARDDAIPKPLRLAAALGLVPIPGPCDEALLLLVGLILWAFYRERLAEAWRTAERHPRGLGGDEEGYFPSVTS